MSTAAEGPELRATKRLRPRQNHGFAFQRLAPGRDGPLFARRDTTEHRDEIYLGGFTDSCHATRARKSSLIVPGGLPITARVSGDALTVLHTVVSDWDVSPGLSAFSQLRGRAETGYGSEACALAQG